MREKERKSLKETKRSEDRWIYIEREREEMLERDIKMKARGIEEKGVRGIE